MIQFIAGFIASEPFILSDEVTVSATEFLRAFDSAKNENGVLNKDEVIRLATVSFTKCVSVFLQEDWLKIVVLRVIQGALILTLILTLTDPKKIFYFFLNICIFPHAYQTLEKSMSAIRLIELLTTL